MTDQQRAQLATAARILLSAAVAWLLAKFVPNYLVDAFLGVVAMAIICLCSLAQKKDTVAGVISQIAGVARNLLAAALTYAVSKGWIPQDQAEPIMGAITLLVLYGWGAEQKILTVGDGK